MEINDLTKIVIGCAMDVHKSLGNGYLESVYEGALAIELQARGIEFQRQVSIPVFYKGNNVGDFVADLLVDKRLIIELKATANLHERHEVQLVNYLTTTQIDNGLLINFGTASLQFKRKHRVYTPQKTSYKNQPF